MIFSSTTPVHAHERNLHVPFMNDIYSASLAVQERVHERNPFIPNTIDNNTSSAGVKVNATFFCEDNAQSAVDDAKMKADGRERDRIREKG